MGIDVTTTGTRTLPIGISLISNVPSALNCGPPHRIPRNRARLPTTIPPPSPRYRPSFRRRTGDPDEPGNEAISTAPHGLALKSVDGCEAVIPFLMIGKLLAM